MGPTEVSNNRDVGEENMVYIHNEVVFSHKKHKTLLFAGERTWEQVKIVMLSELSHSQKINVFSHLWFLDLIEKHKIIYEPMM